MNEKTCPPCHGDCNQGRVCPARDVNYIMGWNSALELAASRLTDDFKQAFGEDTLASISVYIKGLKK